MDDFWKLITVLIAAYVGFTSYQQYRLGRERFKLDLFDKRFAVFKAARELLRASTKNGLSFDDFRSYMLSTADAVFLFDDDITKYLREELGKKAIRLATLHKEIERLPHGPARLNKENEVNELLLWMGGQYDNIKLVFAPDLKFSVWKGMRSRRRALHLGDERSSALCVSAFRRAANSGDARVRAVGHRLEGPTAHVRNGRLRY